MSEQPCILPAGLVDAVDQWVRDRLEHAAKYDNAEPLDKDGAFTLHRLAARIYAEGWRDGEQAAARREWNRRSREREIAPKDGE